MPNIKLELHEMIDRIEDGQVLAAVHTLLSGRLANFSVDGEPLGQKEYEAKISEGEEDIRLRKVHEHNEVKAYFKQKING